jgi:hypothetical protein
VPLTDLVYELSVWPGPVALSISPEGVVVFDGGYPTRRVEPRPYLRPSYTLRVVAGRLG